MDVLCSCKDFLQSSHTCVSWQWHHRAPATPANRHLPNCAGHCLHCSTLQTHPSFSVLQFMCKSFCLCWVSAAKSSPPVFLHPTWLSFVAGFSSTGPTKTSRWGGGKEGGQQFWWLLVPSWTLIMVGKGKEEFSVMCHPLSPPRATNSKEQSYPVLIQAGLACTFARLGVGIRTTGKCWPVGRLMSCLVLLSEESQIP